jgi:hypothetical protein
LTLELEFLEGREVVRVIITRPKMLNVLSSLKYYKEIFFRKRILKINIAVLKAGNKVKDEL